MRVLKSTESGPGALAVLVLLTAAPVGADSIALIKSYDFGPYDAAISGFMSACDQGIAEYNLRGKSSDYAETTQAIRDQAPDVIVAIGVLAAEYAKQNLPAFRILYLMVPRPREQGLTGGNIAGISLDIPIDQQLRVYRSMVQGLTALGVIYDPQKSGDIVDEARRAAQRGGLVLYSREVTSRKGVPPALRELLRDEKIDALWMIPDDTVVTPESFEFLLLTSFEHNLPFLAASDIFVKVGALASLTPDYPDVGRQGCELAKSVIDGRTNLASLNVVVPEKVILSVNLKTARKIGLSIPEEIVDTADVVYR